MISGKRRRLSSADVVRKLKRVTPGAITTHAVDVGGVLYPVKEALAQVTGLDLLDFNTNQARAVFRRLGFPLRRVP